MRWNYQLTLLSCILVIGVACSGPAVTSSDSTGIGGPTLGIVKKDIDAKKGARNARSRNSHSSFIATFFNDRTQCAWRSDQPYRN